MSAATSFGVLPVNPARTWWRPSRRRGGQASQAVAAAVQLGRPADVASGSPEAGTPPVSDAAAGLAGTRDPGGAGRAPGRRVLAAVPLAGVLVVQAALSVRLLRADTAYQGEAESLWAGHLEWAHWLHGSPVPPFARWFSGAPVLYPPLGAAADSAGGLAGARALSLVFMLGATALLWTAAGRLFGRGAAFFAAALFATMGPVLHLGAFATYDAPALFLVALAAWCVIRAPGGGHAAGWMATAGAVLALANATAYATVVFDLFVAAVALLTALQGCGVLAAARRAATVLVASAALLAAGLLAGGGSYLGGFARTTLARVPGSATPQAVLASSWQWAGLLVLLACCGIIISAAARQPAAQTLLLGVLSAAAVAGPLNQARLHTATVLDKHVGLGAWFAAIAAGYAVDRFIAAAPAAQTRALSCGACVLALAFPAQLGASQSQALSVSWPNATSFIAIFGPLAGHGTGPLLVEDPAVAEYYLPAGQCRCLCGAKYRFAAR